MTRPLGTAVAFGAVVVSVLWWWNALPYTRAGLPVFSLDAARLSIDGILLYHGHVPRAAVALLCGALLGLSGAILQAVLRNPLADPSTLGISAGAQLALTAAVVLAPGWLAWGHWPVAMAGGLGTAVIVMLIASAREYDPTTLVIVGMLVSLMASALAAAITLSQGHYLFSLMIWNGGSLVQTGWQPALWLGVTLLLGLVLVAPLVDVVQVLGLGSGSAKSLGVNVAVYRGLLILIATALAAGVAAAVGLVAFVGLAAPALARALGARTARQRILGAAFTGGLMLALCDGLVLRAMSVSNEMFPTGAVTAILGGPLILLMLRRVRSVPLPTHKHTPRRLAQPARALAVLCLFLSAVFCLALVLAQGPDGWSLPQPAQAELFLETRFVRLAGAAAAGGLLALAGTVLQRLTANPLASPEVIGVSGGAAVGYATVLFTAAAPSIGLLLFGATVGGTLATLAILGFVVGHNPSPERVLLAGIAISSLAAAVLSLLMTLGTTQSFAILSWLSGSTSALTVTLTVTLVGSLVLIASLVLCAHRWLTILPLTTPVARNLGVPLRTAWCGLIALASLATGAATVIVGPLSFVGLMAPHLARRSGFSAAGPHLLASILIGALVMTVADFGARQASFPYQLPLGLFASLIGAPWLVWLLTRKPAS
ncbi:MAG: Fe(3+)-hydroxamate ABC transporter permease FhuB [Pseudomonadota bacterium]